MKAVIMAGGKGTRIASVASDIPKPMIPIVSKPILEYQIECLKKNNITDIIIVVGHLKDAIIDYFEDGKRFGVNIEYFIEEEPLGTAGALYYLKDKLTDDFLLINGDILFDINVSRFYDFHKSKNALISLFVHPNSHPYDSALIVTDINDMVTAWLNKEDERTYYKNKVNAGLHLISSKAMNLFDYPGKRDLDRDILRKIISKGLYAYSSSEYVKDMGTPDRYEQVTKDVLSGKVSGKNLNEKQKAIFLDRDGTLNVYKGFINSHEQIELIDGAAEAVAKINNSEYLAILITNQPVIARGECTEAELDEIHNKLETLLGEKGAYLDAIYYCPHHPDKGFEGERIEFKVKCKCRKPEPGLILQAAEDFNIDLEKSFMVGDSNNDVLCGLRAGCKSIYIGDRNSDMKDCADIYNSLNEFIQNLIKE